MDLLRRRIRALIREALQGEIFPERINFKASLPSNVKELSRIFEENGFDLYVVGGAVRDMLLGKEPKDYDLVSEATPDQVEEILKGKNRTIPTGKAFGIITVVMPDGEEYEIACYRTDLGSGRRPEGGVEFSTIDQDVKRRDLTINALYYDIQNSQIIDYVGGVRDIRSKTIKTVGSADERFNEDRLRVLRAIRFAGRFGSNLDPEIEKSLEMNNSLEGISKERIRDEFLKGIASATSTRKFLQDLDRFGLLEQILGGLEYSENLFIDESDPIVLMAFLLHRNPVEQVRSVLSSQRYTLEEVSKICFLISFVHFNPQVFYKMKKLEKSSGIEDRQIIRFSGLFGFQDTNMTKRFINARFSVSSEELMSQGFKGKELGQEIERLENQRFADSL